MSHETPERARLLMVVAFLATVAVNHAQDPAQWQAAPAPVMANRPSFDVASIKLRRGEITFSKDPSIHGRTVTGTAITLNDLITYAYSLRYDQISGAPAWAGSDHYDLAAKSEGDGVLTTAQCRQMVQSLLAERFRLRAHSESHEEAIYGLVIGRNGPKFKTSAPGSTGGSSVRASEQSIHMEASAGTMEQLARQLSYTAGRPVFDKTGLTGFYAYTLDWFPENRTPPPGLETPSMFAALPDQLGLRLEPAKGMVERLVIDGAERPSEN